MNRSRNQNRNRTERSDKDQSKSIWILISILIMNKSSDLFRFSIIQVSFVTMQFFLRKHVFSLLLFAVVGLAVAFPEPVSTGGLLDSDWTTKLGVSMIFFLQGLSLSTQSLAAGYRPLRLHGFVLSWNFLWLPAVAFLLLYPMSRILSVELLLGFGALVFLPTTIASANAYTAISGGNVANAIVSTTLSNLLAVFVVPAVAIVYFKLERSIEIPLGRVLLSLAYMLIIPLVLGQVVQWLIRPNVDTVSKITRQMSAGITLLIVYLAFARSMNAEIFEGISFESLALILFAVVLLLLVTSAFVWKSTVWVNLDMAQRIAAFYCASQKSLAAGLPLISSILLVIPEMQDMAMIFIPLLCFHPSQMLLAGIVAAQLKQKDTIIGV